jgi:hypothetical protein
MEVRYLEKAKAMENEHQGALAKERLARGRVEIRVAELEAQIEEIIAKVASSEDNKENTMKGQVSSARSGSDKELTKKLKKLSRTMSTVK